MKERLEEIAVVIFLLIIGIPLSILFLPFIILFSIFDFFQRKRFKKRYINYLSSIEGKKFFCFNTRKNGHHYIEKNVIPKLADDIEYIFMEGKNLKSAYTREYISHMLSTISDRKGFPYLIKINNGKVLDKSLNSQFYNFKSQNKNSDDLIILINDNFNKLK